MSMLSPTDASKKLSRLTERQREVLRLFCQGLNYKKIAKQIVIEESTVKSHMGHIYEKLELNYLEANQRRLIIIQQICPALERGNISAAPEEEKNEIDLRPVPVEVMDQVEDDEQALVLWKQESLVPIRPIKGQIVKPARPLRWVTLGLILGSVLMYFGLTRLLPAQSEIGALTPEPPITEVVAYHEATVIVTTTPAPSEQSALVITTTPLPVTATHEIIPVQAAGYVFSDDFENGPDPLWTVKYGEPGMANGKYTVITPFEMGVQSAHFAFLDQLNWKNASVTFKVEEFYPWGDCCDGFGAVIIHYQKDIGGVGFIIHPGKKGVQFGLLGPDREWTLLPSSLVDGNEGDFSFFDQAYKFRIEIVGDTYIAYIDDRMVTSVTVSGYETGQIGLWFQTNSATDIPRYYAARFDFITIESLP